VTLRTRIRELGGLWLEARCECGFITQYPGRYLEHEGLGHVAIGDWATELACAGCGVAGPEVSLWNGLVDSQHALVKPERRVLLTGEGAC
jgi:hypothetical protein